MVLVAVSGVGAPGRVYTVGTLLARGRDPGEHEFVRGRLSRGRTGVRATEEGGKQQGEALRA